MTTSVQEWLDKTSVYERGNVWAPVGRPNPMKGKRLNGKQYAYGKEKLTIRQWARKLGYDSATIKWHFDRWGDLDRLDQDYHKTRATVYWGKTRREWHEYIANNLAEGQKMPSHGSVGAALMKDKEKWDRFLAKKIGQPVAKQKRSAAHISNNSNANKFPYVTPAGTFLGRREAAEKNGITIYQFINRLKQDPKNWYKKAKPFAEKR